VSITVIRNQLVPAHIADDVTYNGPSRNLGITIHGTGNRAVGANAAAHANLQARGNSRSASWNITVDDREAVRSFPNSVRTWHAGTGSAGDGDDTVARSSCA